MTPQPAALVAAGLLLAMPLVAPALRAGTVARGWNEQNLEAIRIDFPDPAVHARNLFHTSVAMWDAWAAYEPTAIGYVHNENATSGDLAAARHAAISFAAYRVLVHRYARSVNAATTLGILEAHLNGLGYSAGYTSLLGNDPRSVGNRVAASVIAFAATDGSREFSGYDDPTYQPANDPLLLRASFFPRPVMGDPNRWQPLAFEFAFTQNGLEARLVQEFIGSHWGEVRPFALHREPGQVVYNDPGAPPQLGGVGDFEFKANNLEVIRFSSWLDPDDGVMIDCSPGATGNNTLGQNDGTGHLHNPATNASYAANWVKRADYGRVLAEFWADGPDSETPPGHWNTLANTVVDAPEFKARLGGTGPELDPLEWDVKMYFALNAAVHDVAVAVWGCKRHYDYVRPISSIRHMAGRGQSSDSGKPSYHPAGMLLEDGLVEVITAESAAAHHAHLSGHLGKIAVFAWGGEPADPESQYTGSKWILAENWLPYQRDTFVTPAFAGYVSGHSGFSRAAAEVLTAMTGDPFFPGGLGAHTVPAGSLDFEFGPSAEVTLQWATYYDAADQAGISRLYGGIHVAPDDGPGRIIGAQCGQEAWALARKYYDGSILTEPVPTTIARQPNGDLRITWKKHRGFHYALRCSPNLRDFCDVLPFARAATDSQSLVIPAAFLKESRQFWQVLRSTGTP